MLEEKPDQFYSAPASIGEYLEVFQEAAKYTDSIICITLSSKLSAMHSVALLAVKQAKEKLPHMSIEVLDSGTAAVGEGLVVSAAAETAAAGKSLAEVVQSAKKVSAKVQVIGIMETIRYVYRTGRIPRLAARFGSVLNIRPVFVVSGGVVRIKGITQSQENGIIRALTMMREEIKERPVHVAVAHADAQEAGERLLEKIRVEFNCVDIWLTDFSPVMAYATGAGVLAIAYYTGD
jgi:DegV family protein with EDD domain